MIALLLMIMIPPYEYIATISIKFPLNMNVVHNHVDVSADIKGQSFLSQPLHNLAKVHVQ